MYYNTLCCPCHRPLFGILQQSLSPASVFLHNPGCGAHCFGPGLGPPLPALQLLDLLGQACHMHACQMFQGFRDVMRGVTQYLVQLTLPPDTQLQAKLLLDKFINAQLTLLYVDVLHKTARRILAHFMVSPTNALRVPPLRVTPLCAMGSTLTSAQTLISDILPSTENVSQSLAKS